MDNRRQFQDRRSSLASSLDGVPALFDGPQRMVGQVYSQGAIATSTPHYFAVHPVLPGGVETERGTVTTSVDTTQTAYVLVLGTRVPVVGDMLIAKAINGRWVAELYAGTGGLVGVSGCPCLLTPTTFHSTIVGNSTAETAWPQLHDDTFVYGPRPTGSSLPFNLWLGATTWTDGNDGVHIPVSTSGVYRYIIWCQSGLYGLERYYPNHDGTGGIAEDISAMLNWPVGIGNTCTPFHFPHARIGTSTPTLFTMTLDG